MRPDKYLLLTWRKILLVAGAWVLSVLLHNVIYGLFSDFFDRTLGDEPVFFLLAVMVIPLYLIVCLVYTIIRKLSRLATHRTS